MISHTLLVQRGRSGSLSLESCGIKRYQRNSKISFIEWWLIDIIVWDRVLANQELSCPEDTCCKDEDVEVDV